MAVKRQLTPPGPAGRPLDEVRRALYEARQAVGPVRYLLEQAIVDRPIPAVGLSLAMGVLLGWFIKR